MRIAIIGAGIAGLYLARKLSEKKHKVVVFEKKGKIGKEVCSGLFSERIFDFIPESRRLVKNQIEFCIINFPRKTLKINFSRSFFVIDHDELDIMVADSAKTAGAEIFLNKEINSLPAGFDKTIGCDGAMSPTRKNLGLKDPKFYLGFQGIVREENKSKYVEAWATRSGFLWKIPRGKTTEYGVIEEPKDALRVFEQFLREKNIKLEAMKSAIVPQGLVTSPNPLVALCGDATGLTKPWSGGGVVWSLISSDLLLKNFPDFVRYSKAIKMVFLPRILVGKLAKRIVYFFGFNIPWILPKEYKIESDFLL